MSVHCKQADLCRFRYSSEFIISRREAIASNYLYQSNQFFGCCSPFRQAANMVFTALIHRATPDIAWKCLNTILFVSRNSQKCISGAYDIQNEGFVPYSRELHYAKFTLWTPKLQILAKTLAANDWGFHTTMHFVIFVNANTFFLILDNLRISKKLKTKKRQHSLHVAVAGEPN